jgi:hypothetical protein
MSIDKFKGGCHCGNILVEMELARAPGSCNPRICDCDFCRKHGASYVSDPQGSMRLQVKDAHHLGRYFQGSGIADCIICRNCGVLVGIVHRDNARLYGAINSKVIDGNPAFGGEVPVSPKTLPDTEKIKRWKALWFANVSIELIN